jgi:hypothetical protein
VLTIDGFTARGREARCTKENRALDRKSTWMSIDSGGVDIHVAPVRDKP